MTEPEASLSSQKTQTFAINNYESWDVGESYVKGDTVSYEGKIYKCIRAHTVDALNWKPPNTPALWAFLGEGNGSDPNKDYKVWQVNRQFETGDEVVYLDKVYRCRQGHKANSEKWTPSTKPALWKCIDDWSGPQLWRESITYSKGDTVYSYDPSEDRDGEPLDGYKCIKEHTSNSGNKPPASSCWKSLDSDDDEGVWPHNGKDPNTGRNADIVELYDQWKKRYVRKYEKGYKVKAPASGWAPEGTHTEAMGYGMLIAAMMAGCDQDEVEPTDEEELFNGLLEVCLDHKVPGTNLIDWNFYTGPIDEPDVDDPDGKDNASDGDMDIAYACLIAAKYNNGWGEYQGCDHRRHKKVPGGIAVIAPAPKYIDVAKGIITSLDNHCLYNDSKFSNDVRIRPGNLYDSDGLAHSSRTSDWMPDHLMQFSNVSSGKFAAAEDNIKVMATYMQNNFSPDYGLLPDFIDNPGNNDNFDADEYKICPVYSVEGDIFNESKHDDEYYYNACRFPLRLAIAAESPLYNQSSNEYENILNKYLDGIDKLLDNPELKYIKGGYKLDGTNPADCDYKERAFGACAFAAAHAVEGSNQDKGSKFRTSTNWNYFTNTNKDEWDINYYKVSLSMLSALSITDNWCYPSEGDK